MLRTTCLSACLVALNLMLVRPSFAFPQYGYGSTYGARLSSMESSVTHQLHAMEKTLQSAHQELTDARKQLAKAETDFQKQTHEYNSVRQQVRKEADARPELVESRKQLIEAEYAFHGEHERIVKRLKTTPDYRTALEQKQSASLQLKSLAKEDSQETRANLAKQIAGLTVTLSIQEAAAIAADREAKNAQQQQHVAEQELAKHIRDRNSSIDKDARLNSTKTAFDRTRTDHDAAQRRTAQAQSASTQAEHAYQSLMHEKIMLDQQQAQQQRANRYGYSGYGGYSRRHYGPGPLGGALRIVPPPTIIIH